MRRTFFVVCLFLYCISIPAQDQPLRYYAEKHGKNIGVAIRESYISQGMAAHNNLVAKEFNTVVCENAMKSSSVTSSKTSYNFSTGDAVVNFAITNKMKIRGHTLFWHGQNAAWISTGTRAQVLDNMNYLAKKMLEHYKGKVFQWDVVNEAYADEGATMRNNGYRSIVGADFIDSAFVYAHRADPDCKLFYNDFNIETINVKSDAVYAVTTFMIWGVRDQDSWRASTTPLIFNNSWQPKAAYNSILELLKNTSVVSVKPNIGPIQNLIHSGERIYNRMTNTICFSDQSSNLPVILDAFNLRGVRTGTFTLPVNKAVPISSLNTANGLKIFKVNNRVVNGSFVQHL